MTGYRHSNIATLLSGTALALVIAGPAQAGMNDWWDITAGFQAQRQIRMERDADLAMSQHYINTLTETHKAVGNAFKILGPEDIDALTAWLEAHDDLDEFHLPGGSSRQTRAALGLPEAGIGQTGIRMRRCGGDILHAYYDTDSMAFERQLTAAAMRNKVWEEALRNGARYGTPQEAMAAYDAGAEFADGQLMRYHRDPQILPACLNDDYLRPIPASTLAIVGGVSPRIRRARRWVEDCPAGFVGEGVIGFFETVNGIERPVPVNTLERCRRKPDEGDSDHVLVERNPPRTCAEGNADWWRAVLEENATASLSGDFIEHRKEWTYLETFPPAWNMDDLVIEWQDPWEVKENTCQARYTVRMSGCPAGWSGDRVYDYTTIIQAETLDRTYERTIISSTCSPPPPPPPSDEGGGGGDNDLADNDNDGFNERVDPDDHDSEVGPDNGFGGSN